MEDSGTLVCWLGHDVCDDGIGGEGQSLLSGLEPKDGPQRIAEPVDGELENPPKEQSGGFDLCGPVKDPASHGCQCQPEKLPREGGLPLESFRRDEPIKERTAARSAAEAHEPPCQVVHDELEGEARGLPGDYFSFDCAHFCCRLTTKLTCRYGAQRNSGQV